MTNITIVQTVANRAPQETKIQVQPHGATVKIAILPHSKIDINMDGVPLQTKLKIESDKKSMFRKNGPHLQILGGEEEAVVELENFYAAEDVSLSGVSWSFLPEAPGVAPVVESSTGLGGAEVVAADSGSKKGWGAALLGLLLAGGSGGGGGASSTPPDVTVVMGKIDAGPVIKGTTIPNLSQAQYAAVGIGSALASSLSDAENLKLMNDIVGSKTWADVDTVAELNNLARIVKGIQDTAAGVPASPALSATDFQLIGIKGVSSDNLPEVLVQIATASDTGSDTATLVDLQHVIGNTNYAPTNTVAATVTVSEDSGVQYLNGLAVSDGDIGTGQITVVLSAPNGNLSVSHANSCTVTVNNTNHQVTLVGTLAQINAALSESNNIAWTPDAGYYGMASISMSTTDTAAAGTTNGNQNDSDTFTINVVSVPDAPTGADNSATVNENGSYAFSATDFGFTDHEGVMPANVFTKLKITSVPTVGNLKLLGVAVQAGDLIDTNQLSNLVFTPAANANGAGYASFTFQVMDNGGTANAGSDTDATPRTFTINVNPVAQIQSVVIDSAVGQVGNYLNAGDTMTVMATFDQAITVAGKDMIKGTNWDDLIVGGAGNDNLTGGLGADTFRAIQYEGGSDTVIDFTRSQGDKIDLRGILKGTAIDGTLVWNTDGTISTASMGQLTNYLDLSTNGSTTVLKVDDNGLAGFATPGYQMQLLATNTAGNLAGIDLQTLINQKVILV